MKRHMQTVILACMILLLGHPGSHTESMAETTASHTAGQAATSAGHAKSTAETPMIVEGLGPGNMLLPQQLDIRVDGDFEPDYSASSIIFSLPDGKTILDAHAYLLPTGSGAGFRINEMGMEAILDRLPPGELRMEARFQDRSSGRTMRWHHEVCRPSAIVSGRVIDRSGSPATGFAGRKVAIRGMNNGTSLLVDLDDQGKFGGVMLFTGAWRVSILDSPDQELAETPLIIHENEYTSTVDLIVDTLPQRKPTSPNRRNVPSRIPFKRPIALNGSTEPSG